MFPRTRILVDFILIVMSVAFLISIVNPFPATYEKGPLVPQATSLSTLTHYETVTSTIFETGHSTQTTMVTRTVLSGEVKLWPDTGVRPPHQNTATPFHAGFGFSTAGGCAGGGGYQLNIKSNKPIYLVKVLTPGDWAKKQVDPEDESISPLEVWAQVSSLTVTLNLPAGDYVLYMYSSSQTLTATYSITGTCQETSTSDIPSSHTVEQISTVSVVTDIVEPEQSSSLLLVVAGVTTAAGAGAAYALWSRHKAAEEIARHLKVGQQIQKPSSAPTTPSRAPSLQPGTSTEAPAIGPGQGQVSPHIGPGQTAKLGPGVPVTHATPLSGSPITPSPVPSGGQSCVHCRETITPADVYCPSCGLKLDRSAGR